MGIPQVAGGRYPTAPPRHVQASVPDYSAGIDRIAEGVGTVDESNRAYQDLIQKKAAAIKARQFAEAKQAEQERATKAKETETQRAHQETEKERDRQFKMKEREEANEASAANDFYQKVEKDPSILKNAARYAAEAGASRARFGVKPGRPMNPPSSTTFNIKSGQEREQAGLQIPPMEAELAQTQKDLERIMGTEYTKTVMKSALDTETWTKVNKQFTLPDEKAKRALVKALTERMQELRDGLNKTYSKAGKPFPVEQHYPSAPIDSLNPAGLNLPNR